MRGDTVCYMSKPVRLPDYLHAEIERLAKEEKRSLANMVKVLLEQALKMDDEPRTKTVVQTEPVYIETQSPTTLRNERATDAHFKPDFK